MMKRLVVLMMCAVSLGGWAQNPNYDPDSNGDDIVGAEDLVSLLAVYNTSLAVDTSLECTFDGTPGDEWMFGVLNGAVILDSVIVQLAITDSTLYYEPGCPIAQNYGLNLALEYTLLPWQISPGTVLLRDLYSNTWGSNSYAQFVISFNSENGVATMWWEDFNLYELREFVPPYNSEFDFPIGSHTMYDCINSGGNWMPHFELTSDGIIPKACNGQDDVISNSAFFDSHYNYFRLLPYWHYAE